MVEDLSDPNLEFFEDGHEYWYTYPDGTCKQLTSVTTLLKDYFPFDADGVAQKLSDSDHPVYGGKEPDEIKGMWQDKADFGSKTHLIPEYYVNGEFFSLENLSQVRAYNYVRKLNIDKAWPELKIVAPEWGLCGTIDLPFLSGTKFYIYDWKTDKAIRKKSYDGEKARGILGHMDNCNYNKFIMQLGIYRLILDVFYGIQVSECVIVHITESGVKEYPLPYPVEYIGMVIQKHLDRER